MVSNGSAIHSGTFSNTLSAPASQAEYISTMTQHEMENAIYLSIPFIAEGGWSTKSWGDNK